MQPTLVSSKSITSVFSMNGMKKMFKTAEDQVQKLTKPYVEQDAWFDEKTNSVERVHQQYQQLYMICTQLYRNRRELGDSFAGLSSELCGLVQLEKGHDKSGYMTDLCQKLGNTYASVQGTVNQQQKIDCFDLAEIIGDHVRILESVKELLFVRVKAFQGCQQAEESLYSKQQHKQRFEAEAKFDKIPRLEFEINELKKTVELAKENFVTLSNTIKQEISVYEIKRAVRMKQSIKAYLEQLASHHIKMADIWKEYLNQAKKL
jgi:archaellum component FlaC